MESYALNKHKKKKKKKAQRCAPNTALKKQLYTIVQLCYGSFDSVLFVPKHCFFPLEISMSDLKTAKRNYRKHYINNRFLFCLTFLGTRKNDQAVLLELTVLPQARKCKWVLCFLV